MTPSRPAFRRRLEPAALPGAKRWAVPVLLLAALAGGCSSLSLSSPPTTFDLSAPRPRVAGGASAGQVVVAEPAAIQTLESDRIIVKDPGGAVSFLGGAQWADRLPRLVQARLIQTFENGSRLRAVSRPGDRISADYQVNTELRAFHVDGATGEAVVEISMKVVQDKTGRIVAARVFSSRAPVGKIDGPSAAQALDTALSNVLVEIVRYVSTGGAAARA